MEPRERLLKRGWWKSDTGWMCLRGRGNPTIFYTELGADAEQRAQDDYHSRVFGSVLYWPTKDQAKDRDLLSLSKRHVTECTIIEHLFRENQRLNELVKALVQAREERLCSRCTSTNASICQPGWPTVDKLPITNLCPCKCHEKEA